MYLQPDKYEHKKDPIASESDGELDIAKMLGTSCTEVRPAKELFQVMDESEIDKKFTNFEQTPIKQQFYDEDHKQRFMEERKGLLSNKVHMEKYPDASWAYSPERSDSEDQLEKEVMMDLLWDSYND